MQITITVMAYQHNNMLSFDSFHSGNNPFLLMQMHILKLLYTQFLPHSLHYFIGRESNSTSIMGKIYENEKLDFLFVQTLDHYICFDFWGVWLIDFENSILYSYCGFDMVLTIEINYFWLDILIFYC